MNATTTQALSLGIQLGAAAIRGIPEAQAGKASVEQMVAESRDPTAAEWAALQATTDSLHEAIQKA